MESVTTYFIWSQWVLTEHSDVINAKGLHTLVLIWKVGKIEWPMLFYKSCSALKIWPLTIIAPTRTASLYSQEDILHDKYIQNACRIWKAIVTRCKSRKLMYINKNNKHFLQMSLLIYVFKSAINRDTYCFKVR